MRCGVTVVVLCVYLSVTTKSATYLVYTSKLRCHRVLYDVFKVFVVWLSLKMPHSKVLVSFVDLLLPGKLSVNRRDSNGFFSARLVCRSSDSSYNTTD